jgi:multisubunit Na+/H+ antiporter MnhF subunit
MPSKVALMIGTAIVFIITVVILLRVLPGPHKSTDYLVIGTLATFVCLLVVFLIVGSAKGRFGSTSYKQRK